MALLVFSAMSLPLLAATPTAFAVARSGNTFLSPLAKDAETAMHSEPSHGSLSPAVWYVDYYDPTSALKTTELKFVEGKMMRFTRPKRFLDLILGTKRLRWRQLRVDSDHALALALQQPELKNYHLQSAQFFLERTPTAPLWKISFWAERTDHPDKLMKVGQITLSAYDGRVVKNKLRPAGS